jgi:hypothetical protein
MTHWSTGRLLYHQNSAGQPMVITVFEVLSQPSVPKTSTAFVWASGGPNLMLRVMSSRDFLIMSASFGPLMAPALISFGSISRNWLLRLTEPLDSPLQDDMCRNCGSSATRHISAILLGSWHIFMKHLSYRTSRGPPEHTSLVVQDRRVSWRVHMKQTTVAITAHDQCRPPCLAPRSTCTLCIVLSNEYPSFFPFSAFYVLLETSVVV